MTDVKENIETKQVSPDFENEILVSPLVNIYETDDYFTLAADMPGVSKENIDVKYEDSYLSIYGRVETNEENKKYVLKETSCGNYYRNFKLSDSIDSEKIEASMDNGQLIVMLPKHDRVKAKTITIK